MRRDPASAAIAAAFALKLAGVGASFVITLCLASALGASEAGHYFLAITTVSTFSQIALLGLDQILVRRVGGDLREHKWDAARATIRQVAQYIGAVSLTAAILIWFAGPAAEWIGLPAMYLAPMAFAVLAFPLLRIAFAGLRADRGVVVSQWFDGALFSGLVALVALGNLVFGWGLDGFDFTGSWTVAVAASALLGWFLLLRRMRAWPVDGGGGGARLNPLHGWPIFFTVSSDALMNWSILAMLGGIGSAAEVGAFRVAYQIPLLLMLIQIMAENIVAPHFAGDFRVGDLAGARRRHRRTTLLMVATAGPLTVLLLAFAPEILALFGPEFTSAAPALRILAAAQLATIAAGPVGQFLLMAGRERAALVQSILSLIVAVVLAALLIPPLGATGAAIALAVAGIVRAGLAFWTMHGHRPPAPIDALEVARAPDI